MEGPCVTVRIPQPAVPLLRAACWLLAAGVFWCAPIAAQDVAAPARSNVYRNGFDDPQKSWVVVPAPARPTVDQKRISRGTHSGIAAEQFVFRSRQPVPEVQVTHALPPGLLFDELTASIWVKASTASLRVDLQVQFPNQIDPRTGQPVRGFISGDPYTTPGEWQQLSCRTTDVAVQELVRRLHDQLRQQSDIVVIDQRTIVAEQLVLRLELGTGETVVVVDDLEFGPIVAPQAPVVDPLRPRRNPREQQPQATIGDDQLLIGGRPSFVLFAPYHGEELDNYARLRFNLAWIDRYDDAALLAALQASNLYAMANPLPQEIPLEDALQPIGLVSFTEETAPILFWYMGTRLSPAQLQTQAKLIDKVQQADGQFQRPILADVTGAVREYHRRADMVGSSRHILNTSTSLRDYYEFLRGKRKWALPERPVFTLIQTEVADANLITRSDGQSLPLVEPEQIWMQGYAALQAGYKGIGFWKLTSLTGNSLGNEERRHAISLFNAHVRLLEPWLASGKFLHCVPATVGTTKQPRPDRKGKGKDQLEKFTSGFRTRPEENAAPSDVQVALFNCEQGLLLLPLWYERNAQFQPGPMSADEISFVIVAPENVQAWEVTTTSVTPLPNGVERLAGGIRIRLSKFDQFTAIVLTQGDAPIRDLKLRLQGLQADCAREWIDLASAKYERVADVNGKLAPVAPSIPNANYWMSYASRLIDGAEKQLASNDFDGARQSSRSALQLTRIVQRRHWENAIASAKLTSGVSSPHTICFQTLPDHWQLVTEIGQRPEANENLLRSGDFEDSSTITASGWDHQQGSDARVQPRAELYGRGAAEGDFCLRLQARSADPSRPPDELADAPERFVSPPMSVYAGQVVHISGKVQVVTPVTANTDGLMIYESTKGTVGALRWKDATPANQWQPFQLIREIDRSQDLTVTIELRGLGDVRIDDLKVVPIKAKQ